MDIGIDRTRVPDSNIMIVEDRNCEPQPDQEGAGYTAVARVLGRPI